MANGPIEAMTIRRRCLIDLMNKRKKVTVENGGSKIYDKSITLCNGFFLFFFFFFLRFFSTDFLRLQCLAIINTLCFVHGWHSFLTFLPFLVCVFLFFCDRAILGGLKTSVVQDYGPKIRTEEKGCSVARANLCLKLLLD